MFYIVLGDYQFSDIEAAMAFYLKTNSEMPSPADIANIIEREGKPAFERSVYINLCKRRDADPYAYNVLTRAEREYISDYEKYMITGKN